MTRGSLERWPRVRRILEDALDQPPSARRAWLERACGPDHQLRAEVETLLAHESDSGTFLRPPLDGAAGSVVGEADAQEAVGDRIGAYRLVDVIAAGGMGTVYRARRDDDDEFGQLVALKVLNGGFRSARAVARFHRERQILARLEHPNVTRLVDGGTTQGGRPYLVMEHVVGTPLTQYASARALGVAERLDIFEQVCRTVQFAHQNLIVHRDLKPDNILVTDAGRVKLLDFGISKLLDANATDGLSDPSRTLTAAGPMTVRYASPEQVAGGLVGTASDVYSLGVILYELLTDHQPYEPGPSLQDAMDAVCRTDPPRPSAISDELDDELDAIVLHALEKTPARRYPTVDAFADDVRRYLDGEAVHAHAPTRWYLIRKAAWRHRWPLSLAVTVFVLMAGLAVVAAGFSVRLSAERNAAVAAERTAEQINAFLAQTLISADPMRGGPRTLGVLELLDDASARLDDDYEGGPPARAALHLTIGRAYLNLWLTREARPHLERSVSLLRESARDDPALADALAALGHLHAWTLAYDDAEIAYRECLDRRRAWGDRPAIADAALDLAGVVRRTGGHDEAETLVREAVAILGERLEDAPLLADALDRLALLRAGRDDPDEARRLHEQAMTLRHARFGRAHESIAAGYETGARLARKLGDEPTSLELYERAVAMHERVRGPRHPATIDPRLHGGLAARRLGDSDRAATLLADAVTVAQESLPEWHHGVRYARSIYGLFLAEAGSFEASEPHLLAAYDGTVRIWGVEHTLAAHLRIHLAGMYARWGRDADAERWHRDDDADARAYYFDGGDTSGPCGGCGFAFTATR